jgi:hypothetical protein
MWIYCTCICICSTVHICNTVHPFERVKRRVSFFYFKTRRDLELLYSSPSPATKTWSHSPIFLRVAFKRDTGDVILSQTFLKQEWNWTKNWFKICNFLSCTVTYLKIYLLGCVTVKARVFRRLKKLAVTYFVRFDLLF